MLWWHWVVAGLVLVGLELVVPSFTIVWFGLGALLVAPVVWLFPGLPAGALLLAWALLSALFAAGWLRFGRRTAPNPVGSACAGVVGQVGTVIRPTADDGLAGAVFPVALLGAREWSCRAAGPLGVGEQVEVVGIAGHTLQVVKKEEG